MKKLLFCFLAVSFLLFEITPVFSQVSVNVSPLDPVYRDLEKLIGQGLVDKVIWGQRPFSRQEIARITAQAIRHRSRLMASDKLSEKEKEKLQERLNYVDVILERLKKDYHEELIQEGALEGNKPFYSLHPLEKVITDINLTNSPPEQLPVSNGIGNINAVINPLVDYTQGRHIVDGSTLSLETTHWFRVSNHFALYAQPRFQLGIGHDGFGDDNQAFVENLYGKFYVKNLEIQIGRDNLFWGQGQDAGILLSNNPRGLDMAKISNDEPFFFPWVFRYMGANKFSFFYADLGPEQYFKNSYLVGYKWSLQPISFLELGVSLMTMAGGQGSPPASFGERVKDVFPIIGGSGRGDGQEISNHIATIDWRLRVPPVRNFEFYGEFGWDDDWDPFTRTKQLFVEDGAWVVGLYFPRLTNSGNLDFRGEYQRTGKRFYEHGQFLGGWTLNQFILGNNLGPNAQGVYGTLNWDVSPNHLFKFLFAYEDRSADQYTVPSDVFEFVKTVNNPNEYRYRGVVQYLHRVEGFPLKLTVNFGYEHVNNFEFIGGNNRNNFLGDFALEFNLDHWTKTAR